MPRRPGRLALIVFVAIALLAAAQIGWWILFLSRVAETPRQVIMIVSEAIVFILAMLVGVWIIYGTLSEQVRMKQLRATFLSAVTHELRSPLAAIRLLLETIASGRAREPEKLEHLVSNMLQDVDRLERLVSSLLRAGQLESHTLEPSRERLDLAGLARETLAQVAPRLFEPADRVEVLAEEPVFVEVDRELFVSAIENLVENASKYADPPREVSIRVAREGDRALLSVEDNGAGLDAESRALIFQPFYRAGDEETRSSPGTGLGLYLVQGIVEAHGGACEAVSEGLGAGTAIHLRVPLAAGEGAS